MDTPLPPIPPDLWPKVIPVTSSRSSDQMLMLEIPGLSENPLLTALSQAIHLEMRAAGEWAARSELPSSKDFPSPQEFSRRRAENAARLLAIYRGLHASTQDSSPCDLIPETLKASASRSYQVGLLDERANLQKRSTPYDAALDQTVKPGAAISSRDHKG